MTRAESIAYRALELGAIQKQDELGELLELLLPRPPRRVLEIGAFWGGTLYCWSQLGAETWAIDLEPQDKFQSHAAHMIWGDSHDPSVRDLLVEERFDLLFIDGDHSFEGVSQDFEWYGPLVGAGGLIAFHDLRPQADPDVGVYRLWRALRGSKREIFRPPWTWGGIGVLEV